MNQFVKYAYLDMKRMTTLWLTYVNALAPYLVSIFNASKVG